VLQIGKAKRMRKAHGWGTTTVPGERQATKPDLDAQGRTGGGGPGSREEMSQQRPYDVRWEPKTRARSMRPHELGSSSSCEWGKEKRKKSLVVVGYKAPLISGRKCNFELSQPRRKDERYVWKIFRSRKCGGGGGGGGGGFVCRSFV